MESYTTNVVVESNTEKRWPVNCVAKMDTGAARTSIDTKLASFLRLEKCGTTRVKNAMGSQRRKLVWLTLYWNDRIYRIKASVTNREQLSSPIILGKDVLEGELTEQTS
jgi:hypothetical protein